MITWDEFRQDFKAHHIPQSVVESKREEFRNLKQGSLSVYDYNKLFQKLARFATSASVASTQLLKVYGPLARNWLSVAK